MNLYHTCEKIVDQVSTTVVQEQVTSEPTIKFESHVVKVMDHLYAQQDLSMAKSV